MTTLFFFFCLVREALREYSTGVSPTFSAAGVTRSTVGRGRSGAWSLWRRVLLLCRRCHANNADTASEGPCFPPPPPPPLSPSPARSLPVSSAMIRQWCAKGVCSAGGGLRYRALLTSNIEKRRSPPPPFFFFASFPQNRPQRASLAFTPALLGEIISFSPSALLGPNDWVAAKEKACLCTRAMFLRGRRHNTGKIRN